MIRRALWSALTRPRSSSSLETRVPIPAKPGRPLGMTMSTERKGTANLFMMFAPEGWRHVKSLPRPSPIGAKISRCIAESVEIQAWDDAPEFAFERRLEPHERTPGRSRGAGDGCRKTKAFAWGRKIPSPIVLLRLVLAYCLGKCSLRSTTTWATAIGLADISNIALYRLRRCGDWLALLVGHLLAMRTEGEPRSLIRIMSWPKAGRAAKRENGVWRIHSAFDLPSERFGQFVLTDEHGGEQLDRIAVVRGEIRLADRVHLQPDRIANVLADGGDVVVRAAWKNARWQQRNGEPLDLLGMLGKCKTDRIDEPVWIGCRSGPTLALRLIAARKSEADAAEKSAAMRPAVRRRRMATNCRRTRLQRPTGSFW